jgi:ribosome production factor 1
MPTPGAIGGPGAASSGSGAGMKRKRHVDPNTIGNKQKRSQVLAKIKAEKKADKRKRRNDRKLLEEQLGSAAPPKQIPRTIDNTRELDETVVLPGDEEVLGDEADDEFSAYFAGKKEPKVMITTKPSPSGKIYRMIAEIMAVIPNSFYYRRGKYRLKNICEWAAEKGFTHLVILNEKSKITNG